MGTLNLSNINSTGNLNFSGSWVDAPSGTVIQYVQAAHTAMTQRFSTTSTSYTATNYVVTITPKTSSSKILICANLSSHTSNDQYIYVRCYNVTAGRYLNKDENGVARHDGMYESALGGKTQWGMLPVEAVDFPNSTSAQTYKLYIRSSSGTGTAVAGWSGSAANTYNMNYMSAMEFSV